MRRERKSQSWFLLKGLLQHGDTENTEK